MSTPLTRDDVFAMLPDLALGMLPREEAERVMAFVRTSPECEAELASLRGVAGTLGSSAPPVVMPADRKSAMRDRLMARATASGSADATGSGEPAALEAPSQAAQPSAAAPALRLERSAESHAARVALTPRARPGTIQRLVPWFAAAASIGVVIAQVRTNGRLAAERDAVQAALTTARASTAQLSAELASRDSLVTALTGAQVRVVDLVSTARLAPGARMFWDQLTNRWTLITHDLQSVPAGRTYQLWLVTAKAEKISAGTFNTDARGRAVVQATYALAEADLAAIAITEEPEGGSPQPTGAILVAGAPTK